jgi:hypothetical protein
MAAQKDPLITWSFRGGCVLLTVVLFLGMALVEHAIAPDSVLLVPTLTVIMIPALLTGLLLLSISWGLYWRSAAKNCLMAS